jgi:hypothetical protein
MTIDSLLTINVQNERSRKEREMIKLHELVVGIYWYIDSNERKEYCPVVWEPMVHHMVQCAYIMNKSVAQKLSDLIRQDPRLPVGTTFTDSMYPVSNPGINGTKSIFYITLPGKPWDIEENGHPNPREIYISVSKHYTVNPFRIVPCTVDATGARVAKTFQPRFTEKTDVSIGLSREIKEEGEIDDTPVEHEKIKLLAKTFNDVMELIVLLASFESFAELNDLMLEKEKTYYQQIHRHLSKEIE